MAKIFGIHAKALASANLILAGFGIYALPANVKFLRVKSLFTARTA